MTFVFFSDLCSLSIDFEVYCDVSIDLGLGFYSLWSLSDDFCTLFWCVYFDVSINLGLGFDWLFQCFLTFVVFEDYSAISIHFCILFWCFLIYRAIDARASEESNLVPNLRWLGRTTGKPFRKGITHFPKVNVFCCSPEVCREFRYF
jgi:hypothetical protein